MQALSWEAGAVSWLPPTRLKWGREPCRRCVWEPAFPLLSIRPNSLLIGTSATCQGISSQDAAVSRYGMVADKQTNKCWEELCQGDRSAQTGQVWCLWGHVQALFARIFYFACYLYFSAAALSMGVNMWLIYNGWPIESWLFICCVVLSEIWQVLNRCANNSECYILSIYTYTHTHFWPLRNKSLNHHTELQDPYYYVKSDVRLSLKYLCQDFPGSPVFKTPHFQCRDTGSIPDHRTKIPHAALCSQKLK